MRVLFMVFFGVAALAVVTLVELQILSLALDHTFGWLALGAAILGTGSGLALTLLCPSLLRSRTGDIQFLAQCTAVAGLAGAAALIFLDMMVMQGTWILVAFCIAMALPWALWAYGVARFLQADQLASRRRLLIVSALGAALGLILAVEFSLVAPIQLAWYAVVLISLVSISTATDRFSLILVGAVFIVTGLAFHYIDAGENGMPQWPPGLQVPTTKVVRAWPGLGQHNSNTFTVWRPFARIDRAPYPNSHYDALLSNGTAPVLEPSPTTPLPSLAELQQDFPIYAFTAALKPRQVLSIEPAPGPDLALFAHGGARRIKTLAYGSAASGSDSWIRALSALPNVQHSVNDGNVRRSLRDDTSRYDQVLLTLTQGSTSPWVGSSFQTGQLTTMEAFRIYWDHLDADGMLGIVTTTPTLFARAILSASQLEDRPTQKNIRLSDKMWGLAISEITPLKWPYRYLLLVFKQRPSDSMIRRLQGLIDQYSLITLFGAGGNPGALYAALSKTQPVGLTSLELTRAMSQHERMWLDLSPTTDSRPSFFHVVRSMHPYFTWILGTSVALLLCILLLPMHRMRRLDNPGTGDLPPITAYLAYFAMLGGIPMLLIPLGIAEQVACGSATAFAFASIGGASIMGWGAGAWLATGRQEVAVRSSFVWVALAAAAVTYSLAQATHLGGVAGTLVLTVGVLLASACGGWLLVQAYSHLIGIAAPLAGWSWSIIGAAAWVTSTLASELGRGFGWPLVGTGIASAYAILGALAWWLWGRGTSRITSRNQETMPEASSS